MNIHTAHTYYKALRLHFTTEYNITKQNGRVRIGPNELVSQPKLSHFLNKYRKRYPDKRDFVLFLVSNFVYTDNWAGVYAPESCDDTYTRTRAWHEQISYRFGEEIKKLRQRGLTLQDATNGTTLLKLVQSNIISLETVVALDKLYSFFSTTETQDPLLSDWLWKAKKYSPFLRTDKEKLRSLVTTTFSDSDDI